MSVIETPLPSSTVKRKMRAQFRALPDEGEGKFEALVSAYNVEYNVGFGWSEMIMPGAFTDSIAEQNGAVPVMYEHEWGQAPIGDAIASESSMGLIVRGGLYVNTDPFVTRIWNAMCADALREYSIAFFPLSFDWDPDNPMLDKVTRGELIEASVCVRGANPGTETLDLRSKSPVYLDGPKKDREEEVERLRTLRKRSFIAPQLRGENDPAPAPAPAPTGDPSPAPAPETQPAPAPETEPAPAPVEVREDALDAAIMRQFGRIVRQLSSQADAGHLKLSSSAGEILRALASLDSAPADDDTDVDPDNTDPGSQPDDNPADDPEDPETDKSKASSSDRAAENLSNPWIREELRKRFASAQTS